MIADGHQIDQGVVDEVIAKIKAMPKGETFLAHQIVALFVARGVPYKDGRRWPACRAVDSVLRNLRRDEVIAFSKKKWTKL